MKTTASFLKVVALTSKSGKINEAELGDYLVSNVQEPLSRVEGVGEVPDLSVLLLRCVFG